MTASQTTARAHKTATHLKVAKVGGAARAALAALYGQHAAAIEGRTVVTAAEVEEAAIVGYTLLGLLKPEAARKVPTVATSIANAVDARDRLFTLLSQRHDALVRAGTWVFGKDVAKFVPALGARVRGRASASAATPVPPTVAPSAAAPSGASVGAATGQVPAGVTQA